jgi:thioredoxin reductase
MSFDVVIVGGGPAGLTAALNLGRARKRVLLADAGPRRNAAADRIHGFVTQDGTPPDEFRRIARAQLVPYQNVEVRDALVEAITGERGSFEVQLHGDSVIARRILLSTGMVDELPDIDGFQALWGHSIFICPYCHAWELADRRFGFLAPNADALAFAILLRSWSRRVVALTNGQFDVGVDEETRLRGAGVDFDDRSIARLVDHDGRLEQLEFTSGDPLPLDVLFAKPPQRQVAVVTSLGAQLDAAGYLQVDEKRQTSVPGIFAAGDLLSAVQSATLAAAAGMLAAASLNHELTTELATSGALS